MQFDLDWEMVKRLSAVSKWLSATCLIEAAVFQAQTRPPPSRLRSSKTIIYVVHMWMTIRCGWSDRNRMLWLAFHRLFNLSSANALQNYVFIIDLPKFDNLISNCVRVGSTELTVERKARDLVHARPPLRPNEREILLRGQSWVLHFL